ncbi:hypothetical protein [Brevibacillus sp. MER 51]|uniref:hypothetical protein n=1 Tax=Brevibacillus sp. MER 51 TaxID=2939560 RepID=UPI002042519E|nr:hypothetical protein [Brevibacillus sp. MER 51]MCM3144349.1 hypothetical protein [Brevibacillus sp. MER 51]
MQAGRELDAKVAEALGWHWAETDFGLEGLFPPEGDQRYNIALYGPLRFDKDGYLETMPRYSTSWNGMGVLVKEARNEGIFLWFEHGICEDFIGSAYVGEEDRTYEIKEINDAPYAICLAFLKAKGIAI